MPGHLAGARRRAFLAHQQLRADLGAGALGLFWIDRGRRLVQFVDDDGNQLRQVLAADRSMDAEDAGIRKTQWKA